MTLHTPGHNKAEVTDAELFSESVNRKKEWLIVGAILILAAVISVLLYMLKPVAEKLPVKDAPPLAEYVVANSQTVAIPVFSQGTINAKTHINLVAEVSGRITHMAQLKHNGGFFKKGELLLSIDDTDYQLAITKAQALVSSAEQQLARVTAEAEQARYDLKKIGRSPSGSSAYALREPHLAEAKANLQAAKADLKIAQLQLSRCSVIAPFDGRVVSKQVDIGQYVGVGTQLGEVYSTDVAQIRLPLSLQQSEILGIGLRESQTQIDTINVKLISEYAASTYQWHARLSHTEGELDARNRQLYLVAEVVDPYAIDQTISGSPPLAPGMFVKASLSGKARADVIVLPRSALHSGNEVWLVDAADKLQKTAVELYTKDRNFMYVKSGVVQGDKVILNSIDFVVNGMSLQAEEVSVKALSTGPKNFPENLPENKKL